MHEIVLSTEFGVPTVAKLLPFVFTVLMTFLFIFIVEFLPKWLSYFKASRFGYNIFSFFSLRFLIEFFYNKFIARKILMLGGQTTKVLDKGSIENVN